MKENRLKRMAENNKFEKLMNNKQELERLSKIKDISEVLDILNKYGYNGNKNDLERDLFEILQGLSEDDLKNISGGKILNKKYLAGLMGGLTMMGAMGLNTSARAETQSTVKTKSDTSFFNKVDKTVVGVAAASLAVGGFFVEAMNLLFRKPKIEYRNKIVEIKATNPDFTLTEEEQKIYDKTRETETKKAVENVITKIDLPLTKEEQEIYNETVKLSKMLLDYAENYYKPKDILQPLRLYPKVPLQTDMVQKISAIRRKFAEMYENDTGETFPTDDLNRFNGNMKFSYGDNTRTNRVDLSIGSISGVFEHMPIGKTKMSGFCTPVTYELCKERLNLIVMLNQVHTQYYQDYEAMVEKLNNERKQVKENGREQKNERKQVKENGR